jgi:hypothetical protein
METDMCDIVVTESAYKHGYTYDDIINCYCYPIRVQALTSEQNKYLYIGFDMKKNPMEILANHNGVSVIFHAMKLRKVFEVMLKQR